MEALIYFIESRAIEGRNISSQDSTQVRRGYHTIHLSEKPFWGILKETVKIGSSFYGFFKIN